MSKGVGAIDSKLEAIVAKLERPPFSNFDSFVQVGAALPGEPLALSGGAELQFFASNVAGDRLDVKVQGEDADGVSIFQVNLKIDTGDSALIGLDSNDEYATVAWLDCSRPL